MARNTTKSKLEKLVAKLPAAQHTGRKKIDTNLYYDFNSNRYYYCLGKDKDRKNKWHSEKDPVKMELYLKDIEKLGSSETLKKSLYFNSVTVEEYLSQFLTHHCSKLAKSTQTYYRTCSNRITDEDIGIGEILVSELTVDNVKEYLHRRMNASAFSTMQKDYHFLNMAIEQAVKERKLSYNPVPAAEIQLGTHAKEDEDTSNKIEFYPAEQASKITSICLSHLTKDNKFHNEDPNNIYAWGILISLWTGMRRGEVLGLKFSNIHTMPNGKRYFKLEKARTLECNGVELSGLKNKNSKRNCAFSKEIDILIDFIEAKYNQDKTKAGFSDDGFIIAYSDGSLPNVSAFTKGCKDFLKENGIDNPLNFHALRHTFATLLINSKKVTPYQLYRLMGHSSFRTTEKYYIGKDDFVDFSHLKAIDKIIAKK